MSKIRILDDEVVKRIAAGETLQRPVNAVKELIENSLDAEATRITVHVTVPSNSSSTETSAGLFSIQVTDNGSGINKEDLELLCERHATSKLTCVGDLKNMGTFGFRGEALASCSQVARVEVITRTRDVQEDSNSEFAWKASYIAGKLTGDPTPIAGNFGTIINVKDLFYGNRVRREAMLSSSDEYQKIVQVIQAYSLNQSGKCSFSLSKRRDRLDVQTSLTDSIVQVVKNLWSEEIGCALLPFQIDSDSKLGIEGGSGGWATRTTFHKLKSPQVIIFLNGRLIDHLVLRRAILQAFSMHLPTSPPAHPFVYLKLELKGNRVDINVHPSKRQVFFLDEEEIVKRVIKSIDEGILQRQYETQSLNPIIINERENNRADDCKKAKIQVFNPQTPTSTPTFSKISNLYPSQRVLTDHRNHRIDTFLFHSSQSQSQLVGKSSPNTDNNQVGPLKWIQIDKRRERENKDTLNNNSKSNSPLITELSSSSSLLCSSQESEVIEKQVNTTDNTNDTIGNTNNTIGNGCNCDCASESSINIGNSFILSNSSFINEPNPQNSSFINESASISSHSSIQSLLDKHSNPQIGNLLKSSIPVGLIDSKWCLLQSGTNLLLCDMDRLNYDMFFSILSGNDFMGLSWFDVEIGLDGLFEDEEIEGEAKEILKENLKFLSDEFGVIISTTTTTTTTNNLILKRIPSILPSQRCPSNRFLKTFLQRLCLLNYQESPKFQILKELSLLYALIDTEEWDDWEEYVKFVLLNGYRDQRAKFSMFQEFSGNENHGETVPVQIITNTETLYKSFERC